MAKVVLTDGVSQHTYKQHLAEADQLGVDVTAAQATANAAQATATNAKNTADVAKSTADGNTATIDALSFTGAGVAAVVAAQALVGASSIQFVSDPGFDDNAKVVIRFEDSGNTQTLTVNGSPSGTTYNFDETLSENAEVGDNVSWGNAEVVAARGGGLGTGQAGDLSIKIGWVENGVVRLASMANQLDIDAGVAFCEANGYATLELDPTVVYPRLVPLLLPINFTLDGLGRGSTNAGVADASQRRAILRAQPGFSGDFMIQTATNSNVRGCVVDGDGNMPSTTAQSQSIIGLVNHLNPGATAYNNIEYCLLMGGKTGIWCDAALYPHFYRNMTAQLSGYAVDGVSNRSYYTINDGISELNDLNGDEGAVRFEGILISNGDTVEGTYSGTTYLFEVGMGTYQSQLTLIGVYFEIYGSGVPARYIRVNNSAALSMTGGQVNGDGSTDSEFINSVGAGRLGVRDVLIKDIDYLFRGTLTVASAVDISGNKVSNWVTGWDISTELGSAQTARVLLPDFVYGATKHKTWTDANLGGGANFDIADASHHVMNNSTPATINPGRRSKGFQCLLDFQQGNITLANSPTLDRFVTSNYTPPAGEIHSFVVNNIGRVQRTV